MNLVHFIEALREEGRELTVAERRELANRLEFAAGYIVQMEGIEFDPDIEKDYEEGQELLAVRSGAYEGTPTAQSVAEALRLQRLNQEMIRWFMLEDPRAFSDGAFDWLP